MKKTVIGILAFFILISSFAQDYMVPDNVKLEIPEDFKNLEKDMLNGFDWLMSTPVNTQLEKRKEVNAFVLQWLMGSPNVSIEISQEVVTFIDCGECLMIFMGGWAKYSIENNYSSDKVMGNLSGVESVISFYTSNQGKIPRNTGIEKYIKLQEKGKLKKHIKSKF